ncbi:MAG: alpha/beta hydrolase, partial [Pyrinomonadaceae bacterium]
MIHLFSNLILFLLMMPLAAFSQEFLPLWEKGKMPNSKGIELKDEIRNERVYQVGTPGFYAFFPSE